MLIIASQAQARLEDLTNNLASGTAPIRKPTRQPIDYPRGVSGDRGFHRCTAAPSIAEASIGALRDTVIWREGRRAALRTPMRQEVREMSP
jgi:hypothetical protein